jgi:DNA-binding beta-propeller fold protein YncE
MNYFFGGVMSLALVGNVLYVTEYNFNSVTPIDTTTLEVGEPILSGGAGPVAVRLEPSGRYLYVANQFSNSIGIIDTTTNELVGQFP